jgi:ribosomal protein L19
MKREIVPAKEFQRLYREYRDSGYLIRIAKNGVNNAFSVQELDTKFINRNAVETVFNPNTRQIEVMLAGEYVKEILKFCYPSGFKQSRAYNKIKQSVPQFYCGRFINRDLLYIDLIGAYPQIYKRLWLDWSEIGIRNYEYPLDIALEYLNFWKSARNGLIGFLASNEICLMKDKEHRYISTLRSKRHHNPCLLWFVNSFLCGLSQLALRWGCCYINTDCFIFPCEAKWQEFIRYLNDREIKFRAIIGKGDILKWSAYYISGQSLYGDKTEAGTKTYHTLYQNFIDNPIESEDLRIKKLIALWQKPLLNLPKSDCQYIINYWSELNVQEKSRNKSQ